MTKLKCINAKKSKTLTLDKTYEGVMWKYNEKKEEWEETTNINWAEYFECNADNGWKLLFKIDRFAEPRLARLETVY